MNLDIIIRTSAILLSGAAVAALLRKAAPSTRHLVWNITIIAVVLAPVLAPLAPTIPVPQVPLVPEVPRATFSTAVPEVPIATTAIEPSSIRLSLMSISKTGTLVVGAWFSLCWLLSGLSVWRGSRPAPELWVNEARVIARRLGLRRDVSVRRLNRDASPHVAGFFRSVVMMPPSAASWSAEARHAAFVHELTHIKRADRRTQAIAQLAAAIYWFNPLVWYASAALARERERACDDEVLRFGAKASDYATLLLDIARTSGSAWTPATALSMARPSAIEGRLLAILADVARTPRRSTRWIVGAAIITLATTILGAQSAKPALLPAPEAKPALMVKPANIMAFDEQVTARSITNALVEALRDQDGQVREQAAMGLAITPGADVIDPLLNALNDPDAQVREKAAIGLAFRHDPKIVEPLLKAIEDDDAQVREKAAIALGTTGDDRAVGALMKALKDRDSQVREKAVAGLILLGRR